MPYLRDTAQYLVVKKPDSVPLTYTQGVYYSYSAFSHIHNITTIYEENRSKILKSVECISKWVTSWRKNRCPNTFKSFH